MHQELSKDGEDHKLGDVKTTPLDLHTLGLHTSNFYISIETLYHINLERLFVCFGLIFVFVRPPHYHLYMKEFRNMCWDMLDAIIRLVKGTFELIFKVTYNCMIHDLVNE